MKNKKKRCSLFFHQAVEELGLKGIQILKPSVTGFRIDPGHPAPQRGSLAGAVRNNL